MSRRLNRVRRATCPQIRLAGGEPAAQASLDRRKKVLNRWIGIATASLMVAANAAIVWRDLLPEWLAGDPPPSEPQLLSPGEKRFVQVGIYDEQGRPVGRSWTQATRVGTEGIVTTKTVTVLEPIGLPGGLSTPPVRIETAVSYRYNQARVDELDFRMFGLGIPIFLHGEAMATGEFPFTWQVGPHRGKVILDSRAPAALGDVIRPFDRLADLYVGRSWRLDLLDPLSHMLPNLKQTGLSLEPVLIQVTGKENITHQGVPVEAFRVEGGGARAWVAADGQVLRQEVNLPLLGRLILLDEPYDDQARCDALKRTLVPSEVD